MSESVMLPQRHQDTCDVCPGFQSQCGFLRLRVSPMRNGIDANIWFCILSESLNSLTPLNFRSIELKLKCTAKDLNNDISQLKIHFEIK